MTHLPVKEAYLSTRRRTRTRLIGTGTDAFGIALGNSIADRLNVRAESNKKVQLDREGSSPADAQTGAQAGTGTLTYTGSGFADDLFDGIDAMMRSVDAIFDEMAGSPVIRRVQNGDSLFRLAEQEYGDGNLWPLIAAANGIDNPELIQTGQRLTIPDASNANVDMARAAAGEHYATLAAARSKQEQVTNAVTAQAVSSSSGVPMYLDPNAPAYSGLNLSVNLQYDSGVSSSGAFGALKDAAAYSSMGLGVGSDLTQAVARGRGVSILNRAAPLHSAGAMRMATASFDDALTIYSPRAASTKALQSLAPTASLLKSAGHVGSAVSAGIAIVNEQPDLRIERTAGEIAAIGAGATVTYASFKAGALVGAAAGTAFVGIGAAPGALIGGTVGAILSNVVFTFSGAGGKVSNVVTSELDKAMQRR